MDTSTHEIRYRHYHRGIVQYPKLSSFCIISRGGALISEPLFSYYTHQYNLLVFISHHSRVNFLSIIVSGIPGLLGYIACVTRQAEQGWPSPTYDVGYCTMSGIAEARLKEERKAWRRDHPIVSMTVVVLNRLILHAASSWLLKIQYVD